MNFIEDIVNGNLNYKIEIVKGFEFKVGYVSDDKGNKIGYIVGPFVFDKHKKEIGYFNQIHHIFGKIDIYSRGEYIGHITGFLNHLYNKDGVRISKSNKLTTKIFDIIMPDLGL